MLKKFLISFLIFILTGCGRVVSNNRLDDEYTIKIDKINISEKLNITSINGDVKGIAIFKEYKMPNENGTTIIAAHSGSGSNAYFNDLVLLNEGDEIILRSINDTYIYSVFDVVEVNDTDINILNSKVDLILLTCKINNDKKRIVVRAIKT